MVKRAKRGKYAIYRPSVVQPQDQSIKYISLTKGQIAIVDAIDYERVNTLNWNAQWSESAHSFYARAAHGGPLMHRFILGLTDPKIEGDHWNGNSLDNRRRNLRVANHSQNMCNSTAQRNNKSGYPGVNWHKRDHVWAVNIAVNGKRIYVGHSTDKQTAIEMRKDAERKYHGDFGYINRH